MPSAAVQAKPRKVLKKTTRDSLIAYSFIAPNFVGFCVFTLVPMVFAIALAFCSWDGRHAIEFVGLKNFIKLFTADKTFQAALVNTIVYGHRHCAADLGVQPGHGCAAEPERPSAQLLPHGGLLPLCSLSGGCGSGVEHDLQPGHGSINMLLSQLGVENLPRWAAGKDTAMLTVILFSVWKNMGYYMVIYLAGPAGLQPGSERSR